MTTQDSGRRRAPLEERLVTLALYVSRGSKWSDLAERLVTSLCDELSDHADYALRVIDIGAGEKGALAHRVFVTPTLIRLAPPPQARLVGQLTDRAVVRRFLQADAEG